MKTQFNRRGALAKMGAVFAGLLALPVARKAKAAVQNLFVSSGAPDGYNPAEHKWLMCIDATRCIGCGLCAEACKKENGVPEGPYFRTWIERYIITKPKPGSAETSGEVLVDSPNGGMHGFPECPVPKDQIRTIIFRAQAVQSVREPAVRSSLPGRRDVQGPDGAVLIDKNYCIGCAFCVQACPYGARFLSPVTHTAEKCTLCYHRITRGLKPACVEICPAQARIFGDLKHLAPDDPLQKFYENNRTQVLKPHLGTEPRVLYAGLDKEVR